MTAWTRLLVRLGWRSACCGARIVPVPDWDPMHDECAQCGRRVWCCPDDICREAFREEVEQ